MQRNLAIIVCSLSIGAGLMFTGCAMHSAGRADRHADEKEARAAAVDWLHLVDRGDYAGAFEWEAKDFRMARNKQQFADYLQSHRASFGLARTRVGLGAAHLKRMAGRPDGDYISVLFRTGFEHKPTCAERVILVKQPSGWRVVDYQVY